MANPEHLAILERGVGAWNSWRNTHKDLMPDLSGVDLRRTELSTVNLSNTNLRGAQFREAILNKAELYIGHLRDTDFSRARCHEANFSGADLSRADFRGAILTGANLSFADLNNARFKEANLSSADLTRANLNSARLGKADLSGAVAGHTVFADLDLSTTIGLDSVRHSNPSSIGMDTFLKSRGAIPESFLRGVGIPDTLINNMKSLMSAIDPIQFYSLFISYSTKDQDFADRLYADLQAKGVRCWFAPHDIQGGRKIHEQIDEAIRVYDKLLLVLSEASMSSKWVKSEIANAREREEKQKQQMLFPVALAPFEQIRQWKCFDGDAGIDSAREIREYFIPDFSQWKDHDSYRKAFDRLMRDLKAQPAPAHTQP